MEKENLNVQLSREDKKLFADYCQRHGVTLSDRVRELIEGDIKSQKDYREAIERLLSFTDELKEMGKM